MWYEHPLEDEQKALLETDGSQPQKLSIQFIHGDEEDTPTIRMLSPQSDVQIYNETSVLRLPRYACWPVAGFTRPAEQSGERRRRPHGRDVG